MDRPPIVTKFSKLKLIQLDKCSQTFKPMRRKKKTTTITIESRERTTIRRSQPGFVAWCQRCDAEVLMVTPKEAAALSHTDVRAIFRGIEAGTLHFVESENGGLLVCLDSVTAAAPSAAGIKQ
jgi:hypothetical protein